MPDPLLHKHTGTVRAIYIEEGGLHPPNIGMTLDVIMRSTMVPAFQIPRKDLGTLGVGACGDVTILELREVEILWNPNGLSMPGWETAGEYYRIGEKIPRHDWRV